MKTIFASLIALGLIAGPAAARSVFDDLRDTAPRSIFADIQETAPRSIFDDIRDTAPRSIFDEIQSGAPRSSSLPGEVEPVTP
jgi:hypothetical protein